MEASLSQQLLLLHSRMWEYKRTVYSRSFVPAPVGTGSTLILMIHGAEGTLRPLCLFSLMNPRCGERNREANVDLVILPDWISVYFSHAKGEITVKEKLIRPSLMLRLFLLLLLLAPSFDVSVQMDHFKTIL
ncbi:hypothetical protein Ancab_020313 [Ancistrocladus abbreviatus]